MQPTGRKYFLHHHFSEFSADILLLLLLSLLFPPAASLSSLVAIQAEKKENCIIERRRNRGKKTNKTRTWARTTWTRAHSTQHIRWWWMSISYRWSAQAIIDSWRPVLYRFVLVHSHPGSKPFANVRWPMLLFSVGRWRYLQPARPTLALLIRITGIGLDEKWHERMVRSYPLILLMGEKRMIGVKLALIYSTFFPSLFSILVRIKTTHTTGQAIE